MSRNKRSMLSARNQIIGKIAGVTRGDVLARVRVKVNEPVVFTVIVAKEAADELGVKPGLVADVVVNATEVMISKRVG